MASSTTVINGRLEDAQGNPIANEYIYFRLKQAGADNDVTPTTAYGRGAVEGLTDSSGDVKASDGTSDFVVWVNGDSDIQSIYEITAGNGRIEPTLVIVPASASGGSIAIGELLINHVVSGSTSQQSSVLDEAKQYTDELASDPSSNSSFDPTEWKGDLGIVNADGGGQLGDGADTTLGAAVGDNTSSTSGGAVGSSATTTSGGAIGGGATSTTGFAGGRNAFANGAGRVQLGTGANSTDNTIQFLSSGSITASQFGKLSDFGDKDTETTITDDDTKIPTSGAVVDYIAGNTGFADYNDTTGDVSLTADTWTDVPNNTLGAFTNTTYIPNGITSLIDDTTGYLDFTELNLGDEISVRNDFAVEPDTNNALLQVRYVLGTGAGEYALLFWSERLDSGSGIDYQRVVTFPIYMGDANTKDNPGKLQVKLSTTGTLNNNGSYISVR